MKKELIVMLSFITMHSYTMETAHSLPHEMIVTIMQYSLPKLNLCYENTHKPGKWFHTEKGIVPDNSPEIDKRNTSNAIKNLQQIFSVINIFNPVSKHYHNYLATNIATWLGINKDNVNALLIRSTQAHIPYFIKLAIIHKADPNCIHKPDGYTPLLYATKNNHYNTCKFLLESGACVNIKRDVPYAAYSHDPYELPIRTGIKNNNLRLVQLFIQHNAELDPFSPIPAPSLLHLAVEQNNPYILSALLEARSHITSYNHWAKDTIRDALEVSKRFKANTDKEKLEKKVCINMLEEAHAKSTQSLDLMEIFFMTVHK